MLGTSRTGWMSGDGQDWWESLLPTSPPPLCSEDHGRPHEGSVSGPSTKTTLKLQLEATAPVAPTWPQKLVPAGLLQRSWFLLLGNGMGWRDGADVCVSK